MLSGVVDGEAELVAAGSCDEVVADAGGLLDAELDAVVDTLIKAMVDALADAVEEAAVSKAAGSTKPAFFAQAGRSSSWE